MAHSVSNDALWEKLIEIDKKLDELSVIQKPSSPKEELTGIKPDFDSIKEEIITEIKERALLLGKHSDIHFEANRQNIQILDENILKTHRIVARIWNQQKEFAELPQEDKDNYFIFRFFKVRKTSLIIGILGLLVFFLTLFCMKQQNDYAILINTYLFQ